MKIFLILIFLVPNAFALDECFTYKIKDQLKSVGQCQKRYPPQSTFKMAISMMGFDAGILKDSKHPLIPFKKGYPASLESWKSPQDPQSWIKNSCVWYSQFVTRNLGMERFKKYLKQFDYGNQDVSGTKYKPDALATGWITSSLKISPEEEVIFLEKFLDSKLGLKKEAEIYTKEILFLEELANGWKVYGKTGAGDLLNKDGTNSKEFERGWFVGWAEKKSERIIFAQYLEVKNLKTKENNFSYIASKKAKALAFEKIIQLIKLD